MTYYVTDFLVFAPFYTVLCLVVFTLLRLYGGMWRYAGLNDLNRMIAASLMTCAIHVAGTMLFVCRMPITYDVIGWFIVLYFIGAYFRLYPRKLFANTKFWGWATVSCVLMACSGCMTGIGSVFSRSTGMPNRQFAKSLASHRTNGGQLKEGYA